MMTNYQLPLFPNTDDMPTAQCNLWVIVFITATVSIGGNTYSTIEKLIFPDGGKIYDSVNDTLHNTLTVKHGYRGYYDELITAIATAATGLNVDNMELISAFVSPCPPHESLSWNSAKSAWQSSDMSIVYSSSYGVFLDNMNYDEEDFGGYTHEGFTSIQTTDNGTYHVTDFDGNIIGNLPWGVSVNCFRTVVDVGPAAGYLKVYFYSSGLKTMLPLRSSMNGLAFSIPLPNIPVTTNYWSDYVLSGQRNYDRQNREIAREQSAIQGLTGVGTSTVAGAVGGAMLGGPAGAAAGVGVGSVGSLAATGINYWTSGIYNERLNALQDDLYSRQKNTIIETACSQYWRTINPIGNVTGPRVIYLEGDSVSATERSTDVSINGYRVHNTPSTTTSYIAAGGPLQISDLVLTGPAPAVAKDSIKNILASGIYIVERNSGGVAP